MLGLSSFGEAPKTSEHWLEEAYSLRNESLLGAVGDGASLTGLMFLVRRLESSFHHMNTNDTTKSRPGSIESWRRGLDRRNFLTCAGGVAVVAASARLGWDAQERFLRSSVFIGRAGSYQDDLARVIRSGLVELGLSRDRFRDKIVLLKPNFVEPSSEAPWVCTHPALVAAAAEVFLGWGVRELFIAEAPGHCRDSQLVLETAGCLPVLRDYKIDFADLNYDDVVFKRNRLGFTKLEKFLLPKTLERADWIVSMPKLKTHHWAGVTLSLKNMFGVLPGVHYGWPKNVLHHAGINESIIDLNAVVKPNLAIVDAVVGMEGDGPLMGSPKALGGIVMGENPTAVDATCARLMDVVPERIPYLAMASGRLGPIKEGHILQRGETISSLRARFLPAPRWQSIVAENVLHERS